MRRLLNCAIVVALLAASGCGIGDLKFREDRRIEIESPADRAEVQLPIVVEWKAQRSRIGGTDSGPADPGRHFGVFVNVVPQPPGKGLEYFFRKDPTCRPAKSCVTAEYLARVGVFETTETTFTIENIGQRSGVPKDQQDWHEVTVAMLDASGRRIGEFGDWVLLKLKR